MCWCELPFSVLNKIFWQFRKQKKERNRNGKLLKLQGYKDLICNKHVNGLVFILQINLISCLGNL